MKNLEQIQMATSHLLANFLELEWPIKGHTNTLICRKQKLFHRQKFIYERCIPAGY